ncbi:MAG: FCD domain-containing protein [Pseudomonadota bacterium]|jgi:DNA-binding GntR family transcriptional regulator
MSLTDADVLEAHEAADEPRTLIETAYRQLRRDIIDGSHQAGQKLRVEHLKASYQVSAGTLREALALLVSDSLVVAQGQRGFRVAPMSLADLEDLTRMRVLLECEAVRESIALGKDDWEASVVSAFHKLTLAEQRLRVDPKGAFDDWESCNRQFHEALVAACRSRWMLRFRRLLYQQSERYRRVSAIKGPPPVEVHDEHRAIFDAVMARNADLAGAVLTAHVHRALTVIRKAGLLK